MRESVRCDIVAWLDDRPQPGWVEARLTDVNGKTWTFHDKPPIFSAEVITAKTPLPVAAGVPCEVLSRRNSPGGEIVTVRTRFLDPGATFDVFSSQLTDT